jgi:nucleoside 2-deoxyribosyltransferase
MSDFDDRSRRLARERYWQKYAKDEYNCPDCGRGQQQIIGKFQVHHKSDNPHDNRIEQLIGLCGFCHRLREDKKPSLERIKKYRDQEATQPEPDRDTVIERRAEPLIYTAGRMVWHNDEDSSYRAAIDKRPEIQAEFLHPQDSYFDHGGDFVTGCVSEDIDLVEQADGIVAFFDDTGQTGTITELFHALRNGIPALVLFSCGDVVADPRDETYSRPSRTRKNLPRPVGRVHQRLESRLWFLVNYLEGDKAENPQRTPHERTLDVEWSGTNATTAIVSGNDGSIPEAIKSWVENDFRTINYEDDGGDKTEAAEIASEIADPEHKDD